MRVIQTSIMCITFISLPLQTTYQHIKKARNYKQAGLFKKAVKHYKKAFEKNKTDINIMLELALAHMPLGHYQKALALHDQILSYVPDHVDILRNKGFILKKMHHYPEAITVYQQALHQYPYDARLQRGISHAYLILGNFVQGWPAYEYRWIQPPSYIQEFKKYIEQHHDLTGKTVLLKTEYGLGDTMQFIRYAQLVKKLGATIIVESQKPLVELLSLCDFIDHVVPAGNTMPSTDFTCLLMSLPLVFDTTLETIPQNIPYLKADQKLTSYWKNQVNNKVFNVGICWQADTHHGSSDAIVRKDAEEKSISLELLTDFAHLPHVHLYSLQKINGIKQLGSISDNSIFHIFDDFDENNGSFMDSAAIMNHLDLIITIDTSIAHLAGGLGVPVWVLLPYNADWRWLLTRNDSPWYPTMKLFRQQKNGNWETVINILKEELIEKISIWEKEKSNHEK